MKLLNFRLILVFMIAILTGCNSSSSSKGDSEPNPQINEKVELTKSDVIGEWFASGNGVKSKYIFSSDGTYLFYSEILGEFGSDEGRWNIYSNALNTISNSGYRGTGKFSEDYTVLYINNMAYSR